MQRQYLNIGERQLHYRVGGEGPPVVMLHPSPLSSAAVMPMGTALAHHFRVYALDTPGYGQSDPPEARPGSLDDYLPGFAAALDALGLDQVCLYGAATGAQFAVEFARRYPARVTLAVLDSAGHIDAEECERIVERYFPDVTPRADGAHLATTWQMARDLGVFFPWCDTRAARRIARDLPPPAATQSMLVDYLRAGERYEWAYRPAFYNERAERAQGVTVPAVLMRWESSVVLRITDELIAAGLPPNYHVLRLGPTLAERIEGLTAYLVANHHGAAAPAIPAGPTAPPPGRFASRYLPLRGGLLHLRVRAAAAQAVADGAAWPATTTWRVGLMGPAGAAALIERQAAGWPQDLPAVLVDLSGCGNSDVLLPPEATLEQHSELLGEALTALGVREAELVGWRGGAGVALEFALREPARVRRLTLDRAGLPDAAERVDALQHEARDFSPRAAGTHLLEAWQLLRDRRLWRAAHRPERASILPGEPRLDPRSIQRELVELMKLGPRYAAARGAELQYAHEPKLPKVAAQLVDLAID